MGLELSLEPPTGWTESDAQMEVPVSVQMNRAVPLAADAAPRGGRKAKPNGNGRRTRYGMGYEFRMRQQQQPQSAHGSMGVRGNGTHRSKR